MTDEFNQTFHDAPVDALAADALAAHGLRLARVDDTVRAETDAWLETVARGFLGDEPNEARRQGFFEHLTERRKLGVYDDAAPLPALPVATFASWGTRLTVPGGELRAFAISSVTVAPTHRRRGALRSVMSGELRAAASHGYPVAVLTVSESTIYGRFGFAPAAFAAHWTIDLGRANWIGPEAPGRIDFVSREQGRAQAEQLHERIRPTSAGEIAMPAGHWDRFFGTRPDVEKAERLRVVQYRSPEGAVDGLAVYSVTENEHDFAASTVDVHLLLAASDDAYAGLWQFLLTMDLIATVRATELSVDEPLRWMIADQRAATVTVRDHQYVRILDVPAALSARDYAVADSVALDVSDPLGIASGSYVLTTDAAGVASVDLVDDIPLGIPVVRLGVTELSAMLLGGVSVNALARAGRVSCDAPDRVARLFATAAAPRLSFWY